MKPPRYIGRLLYLGLWLLAIIMLVAMLATFMS